MSITFVSESSGTKKTLWANKCLGNGAFGTVLTLVDKNGQDTDLVCKIVDICQSGDPDSISASDRDKTRLQNERRYRLKTAINELKFLRETQLLEGYQREGNSFTIVMKKVNGICADKIAHPNKSQCLYGALRTLHRQNIAHFDGHEGNFIWSHDKAQAIDFGLSEEYSHINACFDTLLFISLQEDIETQALVLNPSQYGDIFTKYLNFYIKDMAFYAKNHPFETCQQAFTIGAIALSAIYGIPALSITHMMAREFISGLFINQLGKEIASKGLKYISSFLLANKYNTQEEIQTLRSTIEMLQFSLSATLAYSQLSYHWLKGGQTGALQLLDGIKDKTWHAIFSSVSPKDILHTGLMYLPISSLIDTLSKFSENYVLPELLVKKKADLLFQYHPSLYLKSSWTMLQNQVQKLRF